MKVITSQIYDFNFGKWYKIEVRLTALEVAQSRRMQWNSKNELKI